MAPKSQVYIAGVGFTPLSKSSSAKEVAPLVSAVTKALLDAGITYDDVTHGVSSKTSEHTSIVFKAFDEGGIEVKTVDDGSELDSSAQLIEQQNAQCVLVITAGKRGAVALVLASDDFLWRHPYLKDSSALVSSADNSGSQSSNNGLYGVCQIVWTLRGWSHNNREGGGKSSIRVKAGGKQTYELSRADKQSIPKWKEVEHKQDGKHRLGYNPATDTKEISQEDFEAVRAEGKEQRKSDKQPKFERQGGDRAALAKL